MITIKKFLLGILLSSPLTAMAQQLEVGVIDFYGLSAPGAPKRSQVEACLSFKVGTMIGSENKNVWKENSIECLRKLDGVKQATIEGVCCDQTNRAMIFVGISQREAAGQTYPALSSEIRLPAKIIAAYDTLMADSLNAILAGQSTEEDSSGHAVFAYPGAHEPQQLFTSYAASDLNTLCEVLHHSKYAKDREVACWIIPFYRDKQSIVNDLVGAAIQVKM